MSAELAAVPDRTPLPDPPLFDEAMDAMPWDTQFEVAFILDELTGADRATIDMAAGNRVIADMRALPVYADGVRPEWRRVIGA